jgi:sensor histidine kinase YesM
MKERVEIVFLNTSIKMGKVHMNRNIKMVLGLSAAITVLVHFSDLFEKMATVDFEFNAILYFVLHGLVELSITFIACLLLFWVNFYVIKPLKPEAKIKGFHYFIALVASYVLVLFMTHYLFALRKVLFDIEMAPQQLYLMFKDFFLALFVLVSTHVIRIINQRNKNRREVQDLKLDVLQHQFDVLKNQVSPHFLFNTLNSLKTLIKESPLAAQDYLDHLSSVLRYSLSITEKKLVSLCEELDYVKSYIHLIELRFGSNIVFLFDINESFLHYKIPPSALQSLLENAIKHNEISNKNKLNITIYTPESGSVIVKNNINTKFSPEPGLGLGLSNLHNQFKILSGKDISISKENGSFIVELPLIEV